ncbi:MAG: 2-amino-4-hydroxy-6-hydroxymethyldihydropteridine diphosphokinase [Bacteroidetes bacterium]|nr:2-amino-4-hydroxy-6-hydroxymethyldihydropteridine diphosphokinase [Bacteroidota bacterium]MBS1931340.1 2-amino-4-hydroxy-6-hydroxymethyldihydropteridine diphosphokinase [Bacteroidota bacterium]
MNSAYLLSGTNLGDRLENIKTAAQLISEHCGTITTHSSVYETAAWGKTDQPSFLNQALKLSTTLNAKQLIRRLLKIEQQMGRIRHEKYGPRKIDIDILFFNDEIYNLPFLKIPHPELQNRRFVLVPLSEIVPAFIHPILKKTVIELLKDCPDELMVKKYS